MTDFDTAFEKFLAGAQKIVDDNAKEMGFVEKDRPLTFKKGRKYLKVIREGRSVHCFVDMTNGDVLMAASWKAPAKHARGNIFNPDNGVNAMTPYGAGYLSR